MSQADEVRQYPRSDAGADACEAQAEVGLPPTRLTWWYLGQQVLAAAEGYALSVIRGQSSYLASYGHQTRAGYQKRTRGGFPDWLSAQLWLERKALGAVPKARPARPSAAPRPEPVAIAAEAVQPPTAVKQQPRPSRKRARAARCNWGRLSSQLDWRRVGLEFHAELDGLVLRVVPEGRGFRGFIGLERRGFFETETAAQRTLVRLRVTGSRWQPRQSND